MRRQSRFLAYLLAEQTSSDLRSIEQAIRFGWSQGSPSRATESSHATVRAPRSMWQPSAPRHDDAGTRVVPSHTNIVFRSAEQE